MHHSHRDLNRAWLAIVDPRRWALAGAPELVRVCPAPACPHGDGPATSAGVCVCCGRPTVPA